MQVMPILIGNGYCNFPVLKEHPIKFRLSTNIGDFQNLIELVDILEDLKSLFHSRFSFMRFIYILNRKDCVSLNELERAILKTLSKEQMASYIRPASKDDTYVRDSVETVPIKEIYSLRDSIINVLNFDTKDVYGGLKFETLTKCRLYDSLYKFFSNYFILHYKIRDLLRIMDYEQSKMNTEYEFSESEMIKALLLFSLFLIKTEDLIKNVPILNNIEKIKIDLLREEFDLKESDAEIAKRFKNGEYDWYEGELLNCSKKQVIKGIKQFLIKEYIIVTNSMIDQKDNIIKLEALKEKWGDVRKARFKEVSFKTSVYNLMFENKIKPVLYILDEILYSISIGKYAIQYYENTESSQKLDEIVYKTRKELESLLKMNLYWDKNQELEVKIFDKNGIVYQEFQTKVEFLASFKANNVSLEQYYNRILENNKLVNMLFADKQEYSPEDIKTFVGFSKRLDKYLVNNGDKSRLLRFPDLDFQINSSSVITLFETLITRKEELSKVYPRYFLLIQIFFTILLRLHVQGQRWFKLTGTGFREDKYISSLSAILAEHLGIEPLLRIIISIIKIQTRIVDRSIIKRVYTWKYGFLFEQLNTNIDLIIEAIYKLFKELKK